MTRTYALTCRLCRLRVATGSAPFGVHRRKAALKFRFLEAATRHLVLPTHCGLMTTSWPMTPMEEVSFSGDFPPGSAPSPTPVTRILPSNTMNSSVLRGTFSDVGLPAVNPHQPDDVFMGNGGSLIATPPVTEHLRRTLGRSLLTLLRPYSV